MLLDQGGKGLLDIALTPSGHVTLIDTAIADRTGAANPSEAVIDSLRDAFKKGQSELLLRLATLADKSTHPAAFTFWRAWASAI